MSDDQVPTQEPVAGQPSDAQASPVPDVMTAPVTMGIEHHILRTIIERCASLTTYAAALMVATPDLVVQRRRGVTMTLRETMWDEAVALHGAVMFTFGSAHAHLQLQPGEGGQLPFTGSLSLIDDLVVTGDAGRITGFTPELRSVLLQERAELVKAISEIANGPTPDTPQ